MALKNILKSAFIDVVKAQYEAYLYSLELREKQDADELFPIPTIKATDLTFELKYAYQGDEKEEREVVFDKKKFLKLVKRVTFDIVKEGILELVDYINKNGQDNLEEWGDIKKGLSQKELPNYVVKIILDAFKKDFTLLVNSRNEFDRKFYQRTITNYFDAYIIEHFDLAPLKLTPGDKQWLSYAIQPMLNEKSELLSNQVAEYVSEKVEKGINIIVDSEILKTLPQKTIQTLTLNVKLDDLEEIKVN